MLKAIWGLLVDTYTGWAEDSAPVLAAAASYYLLMTIAPLLIVLLWAGSMVLDAFSISDLVITPGGSLEATRTLAPIVENYQQMVGGYGTIVAAGLVLWGASGFLGRFIASMDAVFGGEREELEWWKAFAFQKALSLAALVVLLVVVLAANLAYTGVQTALAELESAIDVSFTVPAPLSTFLGVGPWVYLLAITLLFGLAFAYLPANRNRFRDVLPGALFTAVLYGVGQAALGLYLGSSSLITAYGAASGFVAFVVWAYYTMQVVLFGAEFTHAWVRRGGLAGLRQSAKSGDS